MIWMSLFWWTFHSFLFYAFWSVVGLHTTCHLLWEYGKTPCVQLNNSKFCSALGSVVHAATGSWLKSDRHELHLKTWAMNSVMKWCHSYRCHDFHATIALVDTFCQAPHCSNSLDSQLGQTVYYFSPMVVYTVAKYLLALWWLDKIVKLSGQYQLYFFISWLKCMLSSAFRSSYNILKDNQGHWQLPVVFGESMGTSSPTIPKEAIPTWHLWCLGELMSPFKLFLYVHTFKKTSTIVDFHMAAPKVFSIG